MFYFKNSTGTCDSPWLVIVNITPEIKYFNNLKILKPAYITLCFSLSREALRVRDLAQFLFYKSIMQIFLSHHHRAFSITISSMGIDSQPTINRGKCSCVECVGFVRGGGVLCDYCECAPVHHKKLTDPNSEAT